MVKLQFPSIVSIIVLIVSLKSLNFLSIEMPSSVLEWVWTFLLLCFIFYLLYKKRIRELNEVCDDCDFLASSHRPSSYDVFINFRGADTRENFVALLYDALSSAGIHAFIDSEELWEGEEICPSLLRAIRGSKISIPVFSEHYADSKYCLLELAEKWERHLSDGQTIMPVFIDVEPRDVRHQSGSFEGSFKKRKKKCKSGEVQRWKDALKEVGNLKGWPLKGDSSIQ